MPSDDLRETESGKASVTLDTELLEPALSEDRALSLLQRNDLSAASLEALSKKASLKTSRKIRLRLVQHPKTPRHISLPLRRHLFTFELVEVTLHPGTLADIKKSAEDMLISRSATISAGEKLTLARQASGRVAGSLLLDSDTRVVHTALENSRVTENAVVKAITTSDTNAKLVEAVSGHPKWSIRREVRIALLRNEHTSKAQALQFSKGLPKLLLREILDHSRLPDEIKKELLEEGMSEEDSAHV